MLLEEMSVKELREELHKAHRKVAEILMEIHNKEGKRLTNLGMVIAKES